MADIEEKHVLYREPITHHGKQVWMLKLYYPNQGGVVKTVYARELEGVIDLTVDQEIQPTQEPPTPQPETQVTENAIQPQ